MQLLFASALLTILSVWSTGSGPAFAQPAEEGTGVGAANAAGTAADVLPAQIQGEGGGAVGQAQGEKDVPVEDAAASSESPPAGQSGGGAVTAPASSAEASSIAEQTSPTGEQGGGTPKISSSPPRSSRVAISSRMSVQRSSSVASQIPSSMSLATTTSSRRLQALSSKAAALQSSSTVSSSAVAFSSASSENVAGWWNTLTDPAQYQRENFGYSVPVIDPTVIASPSELNLSSKAIGGNLFLAILIALVMGTSAVILRRLVALDEKRVKQLLGRLPFQALLTFVFLWLLDLFVPDVLAQGTPIVESFSLWRIPLYAFAFFLVVGTSNYMFNNMLNAEVGTTQRIFGSLRIYDQKWFILLLVLGYGIVGAHINPEFSLLPSRQLGIVLVAAFSIILSVCFKDIVLYFLARVWKMPGWFKANIGGFAVAVVCIALSRSLALSPGYIYGIPVGLLIASTVFREREGFFEFLGIFWILVLACIAWTAATFLGAYPVLLDLSNLIFVILVEDAFFELLPLPYLAGGSIFRWKKILWVLQFLTVVFFLFHTLFNPQGTVMTLTQSPPALSAMLLLGCYAFGVFLFWAYIVWGRTRFKVAS